MAYACISSLMQTLQQLLQSKSSLICESPIQQKHVESSYQSLCALQVFLEDTTNEANDIENLKILEKKIKDVVYKAEDRVDSCLTNMILADNEDDRGKACKFFNEELQQVETEFDSLRKEVMVIEFNKRGSKSTELAAATTSFSSIEETTYVGKTTLARKVFDNSTIRDRFEKHAWVTISEQYNKRQMLLEVASSISGVNNQEMSNDELMVIVYRSLKGRRFLIVIDDLWSTDAWDQMRRIFQNDNNKSRIILTTRLKHVADYASSPEFPPHDVSFLSFKDSWKLFTKRLFKKDRCPPQLRKIGKHIIQQCQGLPLSIIVIAGLLGKIGVT
ncbi:disease resistance protein RPP13-like [Solanum tuberosum]|nr:PREDICTED: disease resistance protein RPP13-like [Solanum tuberosum]